MPAIESSTRTALAHFHAQDAAGLRTALKDVANGARGAVESLAQKTGVAPAQLKAFAAEAALVNDLAKLFALESSIDASTTGADAPKSFAPTHGGSDASGRIGLQFDAVSEVGSLAVNGGGADFSAISGAPVYGVTGGGKSALDAVPSSRDLLAVRSGDARPADVAAALKAALLSNNPQVVTKAARTLQIVESYQRKAAQDAKNYAGTGFVPFTFPRLDLAFSVDDAKQLANAVSATRNGATADIIAMALRKGVITLADDDGAAKKKLAALGAGGDGVLPGSNGEEAPRGGCKSFHDEWVNEAAPGMKNIREAIILTAQARGAGCPFARGNHSKGVAFGDVTLKTNERAPDWIKDLFGTVVKGGMVRVSGSQTNPDEPDSKPHQPGVRVTLPLRGSLESGASQIFDLTANVGDTTHADTGRKHTEFTKVLSAGDVAGALDTPLRLARFLGGGALRGEAFEEIGEIKNAFRSTQEAAGQKFNEHQLYGRHAYFMDGRYVQFRLHVIEPSEFPDPRGDTRPNARLDAVSETVAKHGMKIAMYVTEIPADQPWLAEQEGWRGLPEVLAGVFEVPQQQTSTESAAHAYFEQHAFIPAGDEKVNVGVGLGRHRTVVYRASQEQRHLPRT